MLTKSQYINSGDVIMKISENELDIQALAELAASGNSDLENEVSPDSSAVLCSITVSVLTSPTVTASVSAAICN